MQYFKKYYILNNKLILSSRNTFELLNPLSKYDVLFQLVNNTYPCGGYLAYFSFKITRLYFTYVFLGNKYPKHSVFIYFSAVNKKIVSPSVIRTNFLSVLKFLNFYNKKLVLANFPLLGFKKYYLIGLGFKCFKYKNLIHILLGYGHYVLFPIPENVRFLGRKKRGFLLSSDYNLLVSLKQSIYNCKKLSVYKPKGIFSYKQFKTKIYIKPGKKKQF